MAGWRQAVGLAMTDEDIEKLAAIARSRSKAARRVERARILLAYVRNPRSSLSGKDSVCIIRQYSAASNGKLSCVAAPTHRLRPGQFYARFGRVENTYNPRCFTSQVMSSRW
jgi:hypothetical protein